MPPTLTHPLVRRQPLFVITTLVGLFAIFKPYPSISDTSLYLALLPLYRHVLPRKSADESEWRWIRLTVAVTVTRYTFFTISTLMYATLLGPAFYYLWIYAGSGNANFFYAITLVWCLGLSVVPGRLLVCRAARRMGGGATGDERGKRSSRCRPCHGHRSDLERIVYEGSWTRPPRSLRGPGENSSVA